jgi:FkbM family methyltransferase
MAEVGVMARGLPMHIPPVLRRMISESPVSNIRVRIRCGPAKGARWTLFPFSMYWRSGGELEVATAAALVPHLEGASFWDFGAHFGIHTVAMAFKVGSTGEVAAFEPDPFSFSKLSRHVSLNRLQNVRCFRAAASNHLGAGEIIDCGIGAPTQHFAYPDGGGLRDRSQPFFVVQTVRADDLVANMEIRLPDLIKVDVEGHGGAAIEGSALSIAHRRPVIVMSSHSRMETLGTRHVLEPLGYQVHAMDGAALSWDELTYHTQLLLPT